MPDHAITTPPPEPRKPDPADTAVPLDDVADKVTAPTSPALETALDDDEGGAVPVDPDTGLPYDNADAGARGPVADRKGGASDV